MRTGFTLVLVLLGALLRAQGDMRFFGTATFDGHPLAGANVTVLMDGKQIINLTTGKNGKFKFTIDVGHTYQINYSSLGCVPMFMTVDLHTPADKAWIYPDYVAEIPFFSPNDPRYNTDLFAKKPFIKVIFDGTSGFHDDPSYRFIDEIFKDPNEELHKQQELAKKQADERARLETEAQARKDAEERLRLQKEEDDRRKADEEARKNQEKNNTSEPQNAVDNNEPSMETDAIKLERERQERLNREKSNKNIKTQYENNLLKLVAESERRTNLQKYNKMKENAEGTSVVRVMRQEAEVKAQNGFLIEQYKERQKQTHANARIKEEQLKLLVRTAAQVERDIRANQLKPVLSSMPLNYAPSPNIVVTTEQGFLVETVSTVISWPGGKRSIFRTDEYLWGSKYYYSDGIEIDSKTYEAELFRHKRG